MDRRCLIETCKREAETHCYHCSQDVCSTHFLEHKKWIQEQLPTLVDEVNGMYDRLRHSDKNQTTTIPQCLIDARSQLERWRADSHNHIDIVYHRSEAQIEHILERLQHEDTQKTMEKLEPLEEMRQQLRELLKEGDVTYRQLETMKRELEEIKNKEQELRNYPDIRVITQKIDVVNHVSITINEKRSGDKQQKPRTKQKTSFDKELPVQNSYISTVLPETTVSKCPTCFLIFPLSMTSYDRVIHVEDHYSHY